MALRSLHNALPIIAPERPKKQPKSAVISTPSLNKNADIAVNDENKAPSAAPPPTGEPSIEYITSENLTPFDDPQIKIQGLVGGLESKDWLKVCESLNDVRRFALFHFTMVEPLLEKVLLVIVKSMKNPRSALCKTSIMASADIFKAAGDRLLEPSSLSDAFEQVLLQLLMKASQDKKFVCDEAVKALKTLVDSMTPLPLLQKLRANVTHSNMRVRAKADVSFSNCVSKMEQEEMKEFGLVELIKIAADMLNDRLPEAREAARSIIVVSLYGAVTKDEERKQEAVTKDEEQNQAAVTKDEEQNQAAVTKDEEQNQAAVTKDEEKKQEAVTKDNEQKEEVTKNEEQIKQEAWECFCHSNLSPINALAMVKLVSS